MSDGTWMTSKGAAELLRMDRATLSRHTSKGLIDPVFSAPGPNGAMFYRVADVEAYRDAREQDTA